MQPLFIRGAYNVSACIFSDPGIIPILNLKVEF
jgi:hypothetical protein